MQFQEILGRDILSLVSKVSISVISLAIVGRPNVGKSTLFNRILGKKRAIVHDSPGVTRDWQAYTCTFLGIPLHLYDTPGFDTKWDDLIALKPQVLLWVIDGKDGILSADKEIAQWLRKLSIPVIVVVNKCEKVSECLHVTAEALGLGFGDPIAISAQHGQGFQELAHAIEKVTDREIPLLSETFSQEKSDALPVATEIPPAYRPPHSELPTVVILGKPNAGKSSLVNQCLGFDRVLTSPLAGTTRDSIDVLAQWKGRPFRLVDTAGMRRRTLVSSEVEHLSCQESYRALVFAHVAVLIVDAREKISKQDLILADKILHEGRGLIVALNKWDLISDDQVSPESLIKDLPKWLHHYPVVVISCHTGQGLDQLWSEVFDTYDNWNQRISTPVLNKWLSQQTVRHPPPLVQNKRVKIRYISQTKTRPPTFKIFGSQVQELPQDYLRYLQHRLAEDFNIKSPRLICQNTLNPYHTSV